MIDLDEVDRDARAFAIRLDEIRKKREDQEPVKPLKIEVETVRFTQQDRLPGDAGSSVIFQTPNVNG